MDNLWILTEEKPKLSVIKQIIEVYCKVFNEKIKNLDSPKIKPLIINGFFQFQYEVQGLSLFGTEKIYIKTVSGNSSFLDFLVFKQADAPIEGGNDNPLMAIEETKTSDDESRNTGVYQRGSKFVYIDSFYKDVRLYMLYNDELQVREDKEPSDTSKFGTRILLTLGVTIVGKDLQNKAWFSKFNSIKELIDSKKNMREPPEGNVPIKIELAGNSIAISGRLSKPSDAGNIGHDPNIGALSMIAKCIRVLGWENDIIITKHGVSQDYVDRTHGKNKFLFICQLLHLKLEGLSMPEDVEFPQLYWHYENKSEKLASILLHVLAEYNGIKEVYQNHAGCERGYFRTKRDCLITLPKKDKNGKNLFLPDLVLFDSNSNLVIIVEGKKLDTLNVGIEDIKNYDSIENDYIKKYYPGATVLRSISIFGGEKQCISHEEVLLYLNGKGRIIVNANAPDSIKSIFRKEGVAI